MPIRSDIIDAAISHAIMVDKAPVEVQIRYTLYPFEKAVVWGAWLDDSKPQGMDFAVLKGWERAADPDVDWSAVLFDREVDADEMASTYGDGGLTDERDPWPPGAVVEDVYPPA